MEGVNSHGGKMKLIGKKSLFFILLMLVSQSAFAVKIKDVSFSKKDSNRGKIEVKFNEAFRGTPEPTFGPRMIQIVLDDVS